MEYNFQFENDRKYADDTEKELRRRMEYFDFLKPNLRYNHF